MLCALVQCAALGGGASPGRRAGGGCACSGGAVGALRAALATEGDAQVSIGRELGWLRHYLDLEQLRFQDRLRIEIIEIKVAPDADRALIPALLLQPRRVRIHRSAIVNVARVRAVERLGRSVPAVVLADGTRIRVSRSRRSEVDRLVRALISGDVTVAVTTYCADAAVGNGTFSFFDGPEVQRA